jgi:hypothetical protein
LTGGSGCVPFQGGRIGSRERSAETIVGFLAHYAGLLFAALLSNCPLTTDLSGWYAGRGLVCAPTLGGLACHGFIVSLGGQWLLGAWFFGDENWVAPAARSQRHGLESHQGVLTLAKALES